MATAVEFSYWMFAVLRDVSRFQLTTPLVRASVDLSVLRTVVRRVRRWSVASCNSTAGLHSFPADLEIRRQWLHALGLEDREWDCFSNAIEVEMGFSTQLALKSDAVPNAAPPAWTPPPQRRLDVSDHIYNHNLWLG